MSVTRRTVLVISHAILFLFIFSSFTKRGNTKVSIEFNAVNDTFYFVTNCDNELFFGDVLKNDKFQDSENIQICSVYAPKDGILTFGSNGRFTLSLPGNYSGILDFKYSICDKKDHSESSEATVTIIVENDNDCDGIVNELDLDNDNDGILDLDEGNGLLDSDGDGITDNFDIDSDDDGITDNEEWQKEGNYVIPSEIDINKNGWDDAYDTKLSGVYYKPVDTNDNGVPDFLDIDSDGDGADDNMEAFDADNDGIVFITKVFIDEDFDGLDDAFDLISCWSLGCNSTGSNSPLPDLDSNGIRDWRDNEIIVGKYFTTPAIEVFVYPNPSDGKFNVNIPPVEKDEIINLQIVTIDGMEIHRGIITSGNNEINIENIAAGSYILKVVSNSYTQQSVIIIK